MVGRPFQIAGSGQEALPRVGWHSRRIGSHSRRVEGTTRRPGVVGRHYWKTRSVQEAFTEGLESMRAGSGRETRGPGVVGRPS